MGQSEILKLLRDRPFRPFRLHLSNNTTYEIRHPDLAIATPFAVYVGIPAPTVTDPVASDIAIVSMNHILKIEYLGPPPPQSSGKAANP